MIIVLVAAVSFGIGFIVGIIKAEKQHERERTFTRIID